MDIEALINRCLKGDNDAWRQLVDIFLPIVLAQCNKFRLSSDESDDIFGEVSYKILKSLGTLREKKKFYGFAKTIARNEIQHLLRYKKTLIKIIDAVDPPNQPENPEDAIIKKQLDELVAKAHEMLPERCRKLLNMVFGGDDYVPLSQIARKLGRQESSVRESLYRCLSKLKANAKN